MKVGRPAALLGLLTALLLGASSSHGQEFGKNKVNWIQSQWETIRSPHFDIYYPQGNNWRAEQTADLAEDALAQLEENWNYRLQDRIPIVLYPSHNAFAETNIIGGLIDEGTGGFTEFNRNRIVIPFEGSNEQLRHVVHHELVHALQYELFRSGSIRSLALSRIVALPLWVVEGLAEFESMGWDLDADNILRDATLFDYVPPIDRMGFGLFAYKGGQALYRYLAEQYGRERIGTFLRSLKHTASLEKALQTAFDRTIEELDKEWKYWLKKQYWPDIGDREAPEDFAEQLTFHTERDGYLNVGGVLDPQGRRLAYISTARGFADVYLMDLQTRRSRRIVPGEQSPDFESFILLRPGLAWSPDGSRLAIVSKRHGRNVVFLYDVEEKRILRRYDNSLDAVFTPDWSPDGERLVLVGLKDGWSDLYLLELESGRWERLTEDPYDERNPDWSPDGRRILFSSDRPEPQRQAPPRRSFVFADYNLFTLDLDSGALEQWTTHPADDRFPSWGPQGRYMLFASLRSGIGNLYLLDTSTRTIIPITNSLTTLQQVDWSADGSAVVFSAFQEGGYDLFLMGDPRRRLEDPIQPVPTQLALRRFQPQAAVATPSAESPPPAPASAAPETTPSEPSAPRARLLNTLPDLQSLLPEGESPAPTTSPGGEKNRPGRSVEISKEGSAPAEPTEQPLRRKYTRPRPYSPKLGIEAFGVATQISSYLGFSGQAYLSMSDLLGDRRLMLITDQSITSLKNLNVVASYASLRRRVNVGVLAFHTRDFFLANEPLDEFNRMVLVADRNVGLFGLAEYPFNRFARLEFSAGYQYLARDRVGVRIVRYDRIDPFGSIVREVEEEPIDRKLLLPLSTAYVLDTTGYGLYGPVDGRRWRVELSVAPGASAQYLRFATLTADLRHYVPIAWGQTLAVRLAGGISRGPNAQRFFLGGVPTEISPRLSASVDAQLRADDLFFPSFQGPLRGTNLYELVGSGFVLGNLEWRFTLIERLVVGWPIRFTLRRLGGILFTDWGATFDANPKPEQLRWSIRSWRDLYGGIGFGARAHLGLFILRMETAWPVRRGVVLSTPRIYWSLGTDF